jgi:hypothetical protein
MKATNLYCRLGDSKSFDLPKLNLCVACSSFQMKPTELGMRFGVAFAGSFLIVLGLVSNLTSVFRSVSRVEDCNVVVGT